MSARDIEFGRLITAMVTPFRADGSLDTDTAARLATRAARRCRHASRIAPPHARPATRDGWTICIVSERDRAPMASNRDAFAQNLSFLSG